MGSDSALGLGSEMGLPWKRLRGACVESWCAEPHRESQLRMSFCLSSSWFFHLNWKQHIACFMLSTQGFHLGNVFNSFRSNIKYLKSWRRNLFTGISRTSDNWKNLCGGGSHVGLHLCHFYKLKMKFKSDSLTIINAYFMYNWIQPLENRFLTQLIFWGVNVNVLILKGLDKCIKKLSPIWCGFFP